MADGIKTAEFGRQDAIYVICGELCYQILSKDGVAEVDALGSLQEQADIRMLLHAQHVSPDRASIVMVAEDTHHHSLFGVSASHHKCLKHVC